MKAPKGKEDEGTEARRAPSGFRWEGKETPLAQRTLRLGFVGCGTMGQLAHLENYARLPNVELVAVAEGRPRLAQLVAERYGFRRVYADHRALAGDAEVDAVVSVM